jgi:hypothetical protein
VKVLNNNKKKEKSRLLKRKRRKDLLILRLNKISRAIVESTVKER